MDLGDLRIFKAVAEEGGIIRAAHKLHRVQSSVSTRITQLESSVGAKLFHRDNRRLTLSAAGERLLAYADRLLRLSDEARNAVCGLAPAGLLRLGALESTAASRLPRILANYHQAYPDVSIRLTTGTNDELTAAVAARALDAAFVAEKPANSELSSIQAFAERLVIISSLTHRAIRRPQDTAGDSVIAFPDGCAYRRILQRWLGPKRISTVPVLELSSYHAIFACVASSAGIALIPESVLATMQHDQVARHPLPKVYAQVTTPLIWRTAEHSFALGALQETLREIRARGVR